MFDVSFRTVSRVRKLAGLGGFLPGFAALALATGCRCDAPPSGGAHRPAPDASAAPASRTLPPLEASSWLEQIPVDGFGPASVSVPLGATTPRPIVIALHGKGDRPEWQCGSFRGIAGEHVFVLCPRGAPVRVAGEERFTFTSFERVERETRAALRALKERYGAHVAGGPVVLAGFSLGAEHAALLQRQEPSFFAHLVLVEGGSKSWSSTQARLFSERGGRRVLFVCGQPSCVVLARRQVLFTQRAGGEAKLLDAGNLGHVLDGRMVRAIRAEWDWLVAGDARFQR